MIKTLRLFIYSMLCALLVSGHTLLAWNPGDPIVPVGCTGAKSCDYNQFLELLNNVIGFGVYVAMILVVIAFIVAGVYFVLYPAQPGKAEQAKGMFKTAVLGLILTLSAYLIVKFIVMGLGGGGFLELNTIFE